MPTEIVPTLEQRARFAARSLVEGHCNMLSEAAVLDMATFINGPKAEATAALPLGWCDICHMPPGKCDKGTHR